MKILIIGGCGFFGYHLINYLKKDHKLVVLDNYERKYDKSLKLKNPKILKLLIKMFQKNKFKRKRF